MVKSFVKEINKIEKKTLQGIVFIKITYKHDNNVWFVDPAFPSLLKGQRNEKNKSYFFLECAGESFTKKCDQTICVYDKNLVY